MRLEQILINEIVQTHFGCNPSKIIGIYKYGSRVYGTYNADSDYDFIVIVDDYVEPYTQYETEDLDIHLMTLKHYINLLLEHDIMALECYYQKEPIMLCDVEFSISLPQLRKSISSVVNNSWVKAKKKMEIPEESNYIGLKSLFHSFRILRFGIQIAKYNKIEFEDDYNLWEELKEMFEITQTWESYNKRYKQEHNSLMSEFRKVAPKV